MTDPGPAPDRAAAERPLMTLGCEQIRLAEDIHDALDAMGYDMDDEVFDRRLSQQLQADGWRLERDCSELWRTEIGDLRAELDRLHSWAGLIELLDEHWPADIFPGGCESTDLGPRVVGLIRERDRLLAELDRQRAAAECVDPVYRDHTRLDLETELRQSRSDHRDLYLDLQRRTAERDELRAELDRCRARIAAVLAAVEQRAGKFIGIRYEPVMTCSEIRALLEGLTSPSTSEGSNYAAGDATC